MEKLYSIQYLRALAALLVVVNHSFSHQIGLGNPFVVLSGRLGVMLFFVISGFIMVYISGTATFSPMSFLKRRIIRIIPLYWLFTGLVALIAAMAPSLMQTTVFTWPHLVQSLLFIVHEAPERGGTSPILSLGWTLNYEAYFYIAFAALAFIATTSRIILLSVAFVSAWLLGLILAPQNPVAQFYLSAAPIAFVTGAWIGWARLNGRLSFDMRATVFLGMVSIIGIVLAFLDDDSVLFGNLGSAGLMLWAASMVMMGLMLEPRLKRLPLLEQLGDSSYALYLSHMFTIGALVELAKRTMGNDGTIKLVLISTICIVVASSVGIVIHNLVEKPILRFLNGRRKPAIIGLEAGMASTR